MAMNIDEVLAKVQKMLNVEGRSPEEAAAFVEKAHAILAQYDLTIEDVGQLKADPRTAVAKSDAVATKTQGKPDGWKADLLVAVADAFDCKVLRSGTYEYTKSGRSRWVSHYMLVGFKHDLDAARYAHSFLVGEITRLGKAYARTHWDAIAALAKEQSMSHHDAESQYAWAKGTHPLKAELYFVKGATQTVAHVLVADAKARRAAAVEDNPFGLVVQKGEEIDEFVGREQYGERWEAVKADRARRAAEAEARAAEFEKEREGRMDDIAEALKETAAQQRKRIRAEQKAYERMYRRWERENAKIDHAALGAGQEAGRGLRVRPGVESRGKEEAIG